jgi:hypothetical protein
MEEAKKSVWSRWLLLRLATYSVAASLFMAALHAYFTWNLALPFTATPEMKIRDLAGYAFVVFWVVFPVAGAIIGTYRFILSLIKYRQITSRSEAADLPHDSAD